MLTYPFTSFKLAKKILAERSNKLEFFDHSLYHVFLNAKVLSGPTIWVEKKKVGYIIISSSEAR